MTRIINNIVKCLKLVGCIILFCIIARVFVGEPCTVPSESMAPTILPGDRIWIDYVTYGARMPKQWADIPIVNVFTWISRLREADQLSDWGYHRMKGCRKPRVGDMAVFNSPEYPHPLLVKRIASIIDAGATITVTLDNYEMMKDIIENEGYVTYLRGGTIVIDGRRDSTVVLKQPYYFMRGDNRDNSRDSRVFGFVPETAIVGKMNFVFYSIDNEKKGLNKFRMNKFLRVID